MTSMGWYLKDGLKCERCYKKLRKAKKRKNRRKHGAPERIRTPDGPV